MEYLAGASGGALGFIAGDVPGAYAGYKLGKRAYKFFTKNSEMPSTRGTPYRRRVTRMVTPRRTPKRVGQTSTPKRKYGNGIRTRVPYNNKKARVGPTPNLAKALRKKAYPAIVGISTGSHKGKFATPGKIPKTFENTSLKNGYHLTKETIGTVQDADCVYVYHSNYHPIQAARVICGALLRSLFRKAGIEIGNQEAEIPLLNALDSQGFRITYTNRNPITGLLTPDNYDITDNTALWLLVDRMMDAGRMGNQFQQYMQDVGDNWKDPYSLALYSADTGGGFRLHALMTLQDEHIVYQATSAITVQNRTQGSSAASTDYNADRIDNQPLKGYLYQFKNGDPRLKQSMGSNTGINWNLDFLYNTGDVDHVRSFGGSNLPTIGSRLMAEPPVPSIWKNIDASSKVHLEPGDMKKGVVVSQYKAKLPELLKKFRIDVAGVPVGTNPGTCYSKLSTHKSQILSMEETLRTPSSNLVTCIFEAEHKVGAYTYTKKLKGVLKTEFSAGSVLQYVPPV